MRRQSCAQSHSDAAASLKLIDAVLGGCLQTMTAPSTPPVISDEPSEPDWEDVTDILTQTRDYLFDSDLDGAAFESATLITMLLAALDQTKRPEELVGDILDGIRELCHWWGHSGLPANIQKPVDTISEAIADAESRAVVTFH